MSFKRKLLDAPKLEALYLPRRGFFIYDPTTLNPHCPDRETPSCIWFNRDSFDVACISQSIPKTNKSKINTVYHNDVYPCIMATKETSEWEIINTLLNSQESLLLKLSQKNNREIGVGRWMYYGQVPFYVSPRKLKSGTTLTIKKLNEAQKMFFSGNVDYVNIIFIAEVSKNLYRAHLSGQRSFCFDASEFLDICKLPENTISQDFNITKPKFKFSTRFLCNRNGDINIKFNNILFAIANNLEYRQFLDHSYMKERWPGYQKFKISE